MADGAQAMSDYMAKSHEEKLRAIKEVEEKKNSEIAVSLRVCRCYDYVKLTCATQHHHVQPVFYPSGSES